MRAVLLLVVCLAGAAMAREIDDNTMVTMDIKQKQTVILKLLNHVTERLMYKDLEDMGKNFKIEDSIESYTKRDVVTEFIKMLNVGFLPRGEIFTIHVDRQLKEVVSMFHMLYYAKDFNTFLKTACWMRLYLNEGMFVYALTVAVRHREDCKGIVLPPPYEIYPYYFINGLRLELTKHEDMEMLGKLIYSNLDKNDADKTHVGAYRYLLIVMKAAIGLNTFNSDNYTKEDLYFPGVKIDNVAVDKLVTYFDDYLMDMTNAVTLTEEEEKKIRSDMIFMARKRRLNHQPFTVTLDILSDKTVDCVVRVFLGPKKDHLDRVVDINRNRQNFVELDSFLYKLTTGKNTIVRHSYDMHNLVKDRMMTRDFWKKIETVSDMREMFVKDLRNFHTGFPTRLLLPRGRIGGLHMVLYVCVTPLKLIDNVDTSILDTTRKDFVVDFRSTVLLDKMPLGFPLDRHIEVGNFFTPNMKFVDVMIFHKKSSCDMKTRWYRWVLKDYDMVERTPIESNYFVDTDINIKVDRDLNLNDF
ncbi:unnamed protein product [Arctia plantaginis]|uniref:Uncharacterized protein n=1 Tax=Arctia plantaginis TaxID=874455 RepID=A0A8S0ZQB4_ARCPL|nr:unnamed protein product [Arctia plantaginis]